MLFQTALDLAESRQGGLFVVVNDPSAAVGRLIAPHDLLTPDPQARYGPPADLAPGGGLDPGGSVSVVLRGLTISNGVCLDPTGTRAYFVDTPTRRVDVGVTTHA